MLASGFSREVQPLDQAGLMDLRDQKAAAGKASSIPVLGLW